MRAALANVKLKRQSKHDSMLSNRNTATDHHKPTSPDDCGLTLLACDTTSFQPPATPADRNTCSYTQRKPPVDGGRDVTSEFKPPAVSLQATMTIQTHGGRFLTESMSEASSAEFPDMSSDAIGCNLASDAIGCNLASDAVVLHSRARINEPGITPSLKRLTLTQYKSGAAISEPPSLESIVRTVSEYHITSSIVPGICLFEKMSFCFCVIACCCCISFVLLLNSC